MRRTNEKGIFLEMSRQRVARANAASAKSRMRFAAWCDCCQKKVELALADESVFGNPVQNTHIRLPFAGKTLACFNSFRQSA